RRGEEHHGRHARFERSEPLYTVGPDQIRTRLLAAPHEALARLQKPPLRTQILPLFGRTRTSRSHARLGGDSGSPSERAHRNGHDERERTAGASHEISLNQRHSSL